MHRNKKEKGLTMSYTQNDAILLYEAVIEILDEIDHNSVACDNLHAVVEEMEAEGISPDDQIKACITMLYEVMVSNKLQK